MPYEKQNFVDGDTLTAENLNHIEDGVYQNEERTSKIEKTVGGTYELVEEITTTEELTSIVRTAWPDGTTYNFKAMLVKFEIPLSYAEAKGLVVVNYGRGTTSDYFISITARQYCWSRIFKDFDRWQTEFAKATSKYAAQVYRFAGVAEKFTNTPVQRLQIGATTSGVPFPIDTTIKIYGVRA